MPNFQFPTRPRGRASEAAEAQYMANVFSLSAWMRQYVLGLGFAPSSRGWCYALESEGLITKGEFNKAIKTLAALRKSGHLGFDLVASDDARALNGFDYYDRARTPEQYVTDELRYALERARDYRPVSFWEHQTYYPIVMVEKIDLVNLFRSALPPAVKIFNARGWADVNSRVALIRELQFAEENYLEPVLLYCGDHDPAGLQISETLRGQLSEIAKTLGYFALDTLKIIRFGLNYSQIEEMGITWIDGLETSSGRDLASTSHPDHDKRYVQDYLQLFGARKVEANALIANAEAGRQLMRDEIWRWLDEEAHDLWEEENEEMCARAAAKAETVTAWLSLLEAAGWLYSPAKALPAMEQMRRLGPSAD